MIKRTIFGLKYVSLLARKPAAVRQKDSFTRRADTKHKKNYYFSENLVAPGIEPGALDLYPGTMTTRPYMRQ
jgi:hypothetical protein